MDDKLRDELLAAERVGEATPLVLDIHDVIEGKEQGAVLLALTQVLAQVVTSCSATAEEAADRTMRLGMLAAQDTFEQFDARTARAEARAKAAGHG